MDPGLITWLANAGIAGIIIVVIIAGWLIPRPFYSKLEEENRLLREALDLERQRAGEAASQMGVTNQLIGALTALAAERRGSPAAPRPAPRAAEGADLTWGDLT